MKETRIKALIVTMLLLCVALSMGCTDKPVDTPASVFIEEPIEEQYDDKEFLDFCISSCDLLSVDMQGVSLAAKNGDLDDLEKWGKCLKEDSKHALSIIRQFKVSPALKPCKIEYELALEDINIAGKYTEIGARDASVSDLELAVLYTKKHNNHMDKAISLVPDSL